MVTPRDLQRERLYNNNKFIETAPPKRSKPLHNFSMPPDLRWGNRMFLRCMKVNSDGEIFSSSPDLKHHHHHHSGFSQSEKRRSPPSSNAAVWKKKKNNSSLLRRLPLPQPKPKTIGGGGDDGIEEYRAKLKFHLRTAAHKMNFEIPNERDEDDDDDDEEEEDEEEVEVEEEEESSPLVEAAKPWNLRKRRAACNAPTDENGKVGGGGGGGGGGSSRNEEPKQQNSLPLRTENQTMKSLRLRGSITDQTREKERRKFSIPLSRKEIDEDFMAMLGTKPSRRPTKRPKIVQKQVDAIFPGLWLSEVTVDAYRVPDLVEPGKR